MRYLTFCPLRRKLASGNADNFHRARGYAVIWFHCTFICARSKTELGTVPKRNFLFKRNPKAWEKYLLGIQNAIKLITEAERIPGCLQSWVQHDLLNEKADWVTCCTIRNTWITFCWEETHFTEPTSCWLSVPGISLLIFWQIRQLKCEFEEIPQNSSFL